MAEQRQRRRLVCPDELLRMTVREMEQASANFSPQTPEQSDVAHPVIRIVRSEACHPEPDFTNIKNHRTTSDQHARMDNLSGRKRSVKNPNVTFQGIEDDLKKAIYPQLDHELQGWQYYRGLAII